MTRLIRSASDIEEGADHLARVCPVWARTLPDLGPLPLRRWEEGFSSIRDAIVSQQISTSAAGAILDRMLRAGLGDERGITAADDDALRATGLSRAKIRYLRGIAAAGFDWPSLRTMPNDEAVAALVALPGIGRWTAEIYLKFALGRADIFAAGDLALAEAARLLYDLPDRPTPARLTDMAEPWRPWRAVAARALWSYYRVARQREGIR